MTLFWLLLAVVVLIAAIIGTARRRRYESVEEEPWRASLEEDEPLDVARARRAEEEFLRDHWEGDSDEAEPWR